MYICGNFGRFNLVVVMADNQSAKFNSLPNFPAIQYGICMEWCG